MMRNSDRRLPKVFSNCGFSGHYSYVSILEKLRKSQLFLSAFAILLALNFQAHGQAVNFSQVQFGKLLVNPAEVSSLNARYITFSQRNQSVGVGDGLTTSYFSFILPIVNKSEARFTDGFGIYFLDDKADADGLFKRQVISASYSHNFNFGEIHNLSLGVQGSYNWNSVELDGLTTGSQFVNNVGFDPNTATGEDLSNLRTTYPSFASGFTWFMTDEQLNKTAYFGFSLYDINQANNSFFDGNTVQLPNIYQLQGGALLYQSLKIEISSHAFYQRFDKVNNVNVGVKTAFIIRNDNPYNPISSGALSVIPWYIHDYGFNVGFQLEQKNFDVGFSFDIPTVNKATNNNLNNATEFSISLKKRIKLPQRRRKLIYSSYESERTFEELPVEGANDGVITPDTVFVAESEREPVFEFNREFIFEKNKSDIGEEYQPYLNGIADFILENAGFTLEIIGHADNTGTADFNLKLSYERAKAIRDYMVNKKKVPKRRISVAAKGDSEPLNENESEEDRIKNRRVEFRIYKD